MASAALAALLVAASLCVTPGAPAATSAPLTSWFDQNVQATPDSVALANRRGFANARVATFDATKAALSLVAPVDMVSTDISSRRIVKPLVDHVVIELADGSPTTVSIDEVAVEVTQDLGPGRDGAIPAVPTIELLGHVGADNASQAAVAFVLIPDVKGKYEIAGTVANLPRRMATSIARVSGDTYSIGVIPRSSGAGDRPDDGGSDGQPGGAPAIPKNLKEYAGAAVAPDVPAGAPVVTVDLMVAYANGNPPDIVSQIRRMASETNEALQRSKINVRIQLLFTEAFDYDQDAFHIKNDWDGMVNGYDTLRLVQQRRKEAGVDLAALVVPKATDYCGWGSQAPQGGDWDAIWSVSALECASQYAFSHELGHNLGGNHNAENINWDGPYTYSRGHRVPGKVRDMMSYPCPTTNPCDRLPQYSNPDVEFEGFPGLASGSAEHNNARSMRNLSNAVAAYDTRKPVWDVPGTDPFSTQIRWTVDQGLLTCGADLAFRKTETINRGQMAAVAYRRSGSPAYTPPDTSPFPDVPKTHTFYKVITWANSKGIMTGYSNGKFGPADLLTRGQTAVVLYNVMGKPAYTPPKTSPFPDVATTAYYYKAIMWMVEKNVANGYANGNFGPADEVQRGQMAVFLYNSKAMTAAP